MKIDPAAHQLQLLRSMHSIYKLVLHEQDSGVLLKKVCETLPGISEVLCSLVVEFDGEGEYSRAFGAGFGADFIPLVTYLKAGGELEYAKQAVVTNSIVITKNPEMITLNNQDTYGITVSVSHQGKTFGYMINLVTSPFVYNEEDLKIFTEIGECLGFSLSRQYLEKQNLMVLKTLEELSERLKEAQALALVGVWVLDIETLSLKWSDEVYRIFDCIPQEFEATYESFLSFIHPEDREMVNKAYSTSVETKEPYEIEHRLLTKKGKIKYVREKCNTFFDDNGNPLISRGIVIDITSMKEAELAVIDAKNTAEYYLDIAGSIIVSLDKSGAITLINQQGLKILGYTRKELLGKNWFDTCIPRNMVKTVKQVFSKLVTGEVEFVEEFTNEVITKSGEIKMISWSNSNISDENGEFLYLLSSGSDITEMIKTQRDLHESKERFEQAMKATRDGIYDWNLVTNEIYYSPGWKSMLGYEYDEIPNDFTVWETITDPEDVKKSWAMQQELITKKRDRFELEFKMKHKDGHWIDVLSRATAIFDDEGKAVRIVGTHVDLTAYKLAEKKNLELQEQLTQVQKMESVGRLAGGVAHDFNNMLGVILGYSEMALKDLPIENPLYTSLKEIQKAAQRSADLTNQLLTFARRQTVTPKNLDLNETIEKILNMLRRLIGENIDLHWNPAELLLSVKIDPTQIDQLLTNLVVNARGAIEGVGRINIETGKTLITSEVSGNHEKFIPGNYNTLTVSDNGCGMEEETQEHIFEPFFTTKGVGEGTGLGLATVYGIVKQNRGYICVFSDLGIGTTFKIYLPVQREGGFLQDELKDTDVQKADGHETILLVEDETAILDLGTKILESFGYHVLAAATPGEAIQLGEEHTGEIQLLITDVVMPEMNGRDLAKRLLSLYPGIKRLFISGYTADIIAHHGILDEAVNFLQKPFSLKELGAKVHEILDLA